MVGSQTVNLTFSPSFGHNFCFKCPNGSCEPILNIYVSIAFQWFEELFEPLCFDPCNHSLNLRESIGIPTPNMGVHMGVWGFFPSHFFALPGHENATPGLSLGSHPCKPFALAVSPRLGSRQGIILVIDCPWEPYKSIIENSNKNIYGIRWFFFNDLIANNTYNNEPSSLVNLPISMISFFLSLILPPKNVGKRVNACKNNVKMDNKCWGCTNE